MSISSSFVRGSGDDLGGVLQGHIVDGEGVLVVAIADVTTLESLIRPTVWKALSTKALVRLCLWWKFETYS